MSYATFTVDTHKVLEHLLHKGYPQDQAGGFIEAIQEINLSGVTTKEDLTVFEEKFRDELALIRFDIESSASELYKFMFVQALDIVGLTVALVKLIPQF